jgi:regulatory protein
VSDWRGRGPAGPTPDSLADSGAAADPYEVARTICLQQLTLAPRTRVQLAAVLRRRAVPGEVAQAVIARLEEVGLVDDAAYAQARVESRHRGRGLARAALAHELRTRGVAAVDAGPALETIDRDRELATARELVASRLPALRGLDPAVRFRRLAGLLARKGYPPSVVYPVVREALAVHGDDALDAAGPVDD